MKIKRILVFAGSSSSTSINKKLAQYAASRLRNKIIFQLDMKKYEMPLYSQDFQNEHGIPFAAHNFIQKINEADAIILALAEHNGSYTAVFKNLLDWASRVERNLFQQKPMMLLSTSEGIRGGKSVLEAALAYFPHLGADIREYFILPKFSKNFGEFQHRSAHSSAILRLHHLLRDFEAHLDGITSNELSEHSPLF